MNINIKLKPLVIAMALALSACGSSGGSDSDDEGGKNAGDNKGSPVVPTPSKPVDADNIALGRALYASIRGCASSNCHGVDPAAGQNGIGKATSPAIINRAIENNKGGMGILKAVNLTDQELQNIVEYIAYPTVTVTTATTTLKGIVADGYISGATVCLDVNENSVCDTNEPTTTSAAGGAYNLSDISA